MYETEERRGPVKIGSHREKKLDSKTTNTPQVTPSEEATSKTTNTPQVAPSAEVDSKTTNTSQVTPSEEATSEATPSVEKSTSNEKKKKKSRKIGRVNPESEFQKIKKSVAKINAEKITHTKSIGERVKEQRKKFFSAKEMKTEKTKSVEAAEQDANTELEKAEKKHTKAAGVREEVETLSKNEEMSTIFNTLQKINAWKSATPTKAKEPKKDSESTKKQEPKLSKTQRIHDWFKKKATSIKNGFKKMTDSETFKTIISTLKKAAEPIYSSLSDAFDIVGADSNKDKELKLDALGMKEKDFDKLDDASQKEILGNELSGKLNVAEKVDWAKGIISGLGFFKTIVKTCVAVGEYKNEKKERGDGGMFSVGKHERWQQARNGFKVCAELLEGIAGVFGGFDVGIPILSPILGMIANTVSIVSETINFIDSAVRKSYLVKRKKELWDKMVQKREKYERAGDYISASRYNLFGVNSYKDPFFMESVQKKRDALRAALTFDDDGKIKENKVKKDTDGNKYITVKKGKEEDKVKLKNTNAFYGSYFSDLSHRMALEKDKTVKDKKKIRLMEALDTLNKINALNEAEDRQKKQFRSQGEDLAKSGVKFIAEFVKFIGDVSGCFTAGAGFAVSATGSFISLFNTAEGVGHKIASKVHKRRSKTNGSENDKNLRRRDIAETLTESMSQFITDKRYHWDNSSKSFDLDQIEDKRMRIFADDLKNFDQVFIGADMEVHKLAMSKNREDFVSALSESFAQGNDD